MPKVTIAGESFDIPAHSCIYANTFSGTQKLVSELKKQGFEIYYPFTLEDVDKYKGKKMIVDMEVRNGTLTANQICYKNPIKKVLKSYLEESVVIFHFPIEDITNDYHEDEVFSIIDSKKEDFIVGIDVKEEN